MKWMNEWMYAWMNEVKWNEMKSMNEWNQSINQSIKWMKWHYLSWDGMKWMSEVNDWINDWMKESEENAAVGFLSYDSKNIFFPNVNFKNIDSDVPLIWFGKPRVIKKIHKSDLINLKNSVSGLFRFFSKYSKNCFE